MRKELSKTAALDAFQLRRARNFARCSREGQKIGDTQVIIKAGKEHRFVVVFAQDGSPLTDADRTAKASPFRP